MNGPVPGRVAAALLGLWLAAPAVRAADVPHPEGAVPPPVLDVLSRVDADSLFPAIEFLGADELRGRAVGTPGAERAAEYLGQRLEALGLEPLGDEGTYFQRFPLHGATPTPESRLDLRDARGLRPLTLGEDYLLQTTGEGTFLPEWTPLVFGGYGIVAPEYDHDDYGSVDVRGKVVVVLAGEPWSADSNTFYGDRPTRHSLPEWKRRQALARGARGLVTIPSPREEPYVRWVDRQRTWAFENVVRLIDVPRFFHATVDEEAAAWILDGGSHSLADVRAMDRRGAMRSFDLDREMRFEGAFRERDFLSANVVGGLRGSDPLLRDEWVLVSAHYDHLGVGVPVRGDSLYNGVVDNAVGCAALLEIARVLSELEEAPRRSVAFLFTTAEEKGLLGARHWCEHPSFPLSATIANLNVDGLAIFDRFRTIVGVGAEMSTLDRHLEGVAASLGLEAKPVPRIFATEDSFWRSDQLAFARAGIPSIVVLEGLEFENLSHVEGVQSFIAWGQQRYHLPSDDLEQPIDRAACVQHVQVLTAMVGALADTLTPPQWRRFSPYANARLRALAEGK